MKNLFLYLTEVNDGVDKNEKNKDEENNNNKRRRVETFMIQFDETRIKIILRKRKRSKKIISIIKKYLIDSAVALIVVASHSIISEILTLFNCYSVHL